MEFRTVVRMPSRGRGASWHVIGALGCALATTALRGPAPSHASPPAARTNQGAARHAEPAARIADARQNATAASGRAAAPADTGTPPLELRIAPENVRPEQGHAWIVALPAGWEPYSSDLKNLDRSRLQLTEDGSPLGPGNATHAEIREDGRGAYSHWHTALYFSTSDNSDPRRNGRTYVIEIPAGED